jgi:hypothetical protein
MRRSGIFTRIRPIANSASTPGGAPRR